jgi:hypothetical protein
VAARLQTAGISIQRLERIEPSLEDTFVAIVEASGSNGARA